jgi:hypothetical protein
MAAFSPSLGEPPLALRHGRPWTRFGTASVWPRLSSLSAKAAVPASPDDSQPQVTEASKPGQPGTALTLGAGGRGCDWIAQVTRCRLGDGAFGWQVRRLLPGPGQWWQQVYYFPSSKRQLVSPRWANQRCGSATSNDCEETLQNTHPSVCVHRTYVEVRVSRWDVDG